MARLGDPATGTRLTASGSATVGSMQWIGEQGLKVIFRDSDGHLGERFVYRDDEPALQLAEVAHSRRSHNPRSPHQILERPTGAVSHVETASIGHDRGCHAGRVSRTAHSSGHGI